MTGLQYHTLEAKLFGCKNLLDIPLNQMWVAMRFWVNSKLRGHSQTTYTRGGRWSKTVDFLSTFIRRKSQQPKKSCLGSLWTTPIGNRENFPFDSSVDYIHLQRPDLFKTSLIGKNQWMTPIDVQKLKTKYGCLGNWFNLIWNSGHI